MNSDRPQLDNQHINKATEANKGSSRVRGDLTLILVLLAIFLFHSPFTAWWSSLGLPWYSIFVFWLILIVLSAFNQRKTDTDL